VFEPTVKVQKWLNPADTTTLRLPYSWIVFEDDSPTHPTVYNGSVEAAQDRYLKMAIECWTIAFPAAIFGADLIQNKVDYSSNIKPSGSSASSSSSHKLPVPPSDAQLSAAGPSHSRTRSPTTISPQPQSKYASYHHSRDFTDQFFLEKRKTATTVQRNKFDEPDSAIMPHAFPRWVEAAMSVSHKFKPDEQPRSGVNRGYVLPEPAVFANHQNEVSRQQYFLTYLKVREVFIAAIDLLGPVVCQCSPKDWRRLLSLELHGSLDSETHEAKAKLQLCTEMNEVAARMKSTFVSASFLYIDRSR
jgi:hypothetical protein